MIVDKWFVDKGFGFGKTPSGQIVFIHASAVQGADVLKIGTDARVEVVNDDARAQGGVSSQTCLGTRRVESGEGQGESKQGGQQVRRAAALTAELAVQSEKKTAAVCDQPPGLDELAGHIESPNTGAGGSHLRAAMMPDPWATYKCPSASNNQAGTTTSLRDKSHSCRQRSSRSNQSFPWRSTSFSQTGSVDTFARSELDEGRVTAKKPHRARTANKLVRSITKWTKACDKRLSHLISYIHHTC